ncbi:hypothetical protein BU24DRAFT_265550 [Aaosphaeria arxii CBS 175.79]|uniref:Uncharacterized protein n=1 Tax=Aaosphaeria arxii CBS 175.79 TaxID=1450172 RepID=A0A6A5XGC9_9PLEO|nr:uncharacterized protein BU24DRAFT_265550 [Aaosphaeria arxii CBS 175.79]KAF2011881.1 hypothetical protein BU24DRAFT_265550 [Aaosphaeria arxii CBS 175.79]
MKNAHQHHYISPFLPTPLSKKSALEIPPVDIIQTFTPFTSSSTFLILFLFCRGLFAQLVYVVTWGIYVVCFMPFLGVFCYVAVEIGGMGIR